MANDLSFGTYDFLNSVSSSSSNIAGVPTTPQINFAGFTGQTDSGGASQIFDSLTGAASTIFHSFTSGISTVIGGVAQNYARYLNGSGQIVGYDRYNNPIYQVTDPVTGAITTTTSPAWPGGAGGPGNYPERVPPSYQTGGVWGWITNMLSLPSVSPQSSLGTTPTQQQSFLTAPIIGGFNIEQIGLGLVGAYVVYLVAKKVL